MYINIGNRREVLWDDFLVDKEGTTAKLTLHKPTKKERVYTFDKFWESKGVSYFSYIKWQGEYYVYYTSGIPCENQPQLTKDFNKETRSLRALCLMKGPDLFHLERHNVGFYEIDGSRENNVIKLQCTNGTFEEELDNFFVFLDENPDCPPDEKIKGIAQTVNHDKIFPGFRELWCYTSGDGINFKLGWKLSGADEPFAGLFDSENTAHYDKEAGVYRMYVRGLHMDYGPAVTANEDGLVLKHMEKSLARDGIRDIRYMESKDFKTWTVPKRISYSDKDDYPLYTNGIKRYERAPHMYVGTATRYTERKAWTPNYEQLGGPVNAEWRKDRIKIGPRIGLAITDAVFMSSRDGLNWHRFPEAFMGAEPEHDYNWIYGDVYMMYNLTETPCEAPSKETELSIFAEENVSTSCKALRRYTLRLDGFASYHADYDMKTLVTKPIIFDGSELSINFATSAIGFVYVDILDETGKPIEGYHSCELFGNTTDRTVYFGEGKDVSKLAGRPVKLQFTMRDADIFSFIFR
ncbi:MAG: hypothetical protein E7403_07890 [Ruminococcaceae bacterium]|nr:hypothetical protein [Oscillospiraceae bacterium]